MIIEINELSFDAIIGILDFEREKEQRVIVTCKITYTYNDAFINYADVATLIQETTQKEKFLLLEDALLHVSGLLLSTFTLIETLSLTYSKPDILANCIVSLSDTWDRIST